MASLASLDSSSLELSFLRFLDVGPALDSSSSSSDDSSFLAGGAFAGDFSGAFLVGSSLSSSEESSSELSSFFLPITTGLVPGLRFVSVKKNQ